MLRKREKGKFKLKLENIVPWKKNLKEYQNIFQLTKAIFLTKLITGQAWITL